MNVSFLLPVWGHAGPFATAYLDVTRSTEEGVRLTELTWRGMRASLADQGAREETFVKGGQWPRPKRADSPIVGQ